MSIQYLIVPKFPDTATQTPLIHTAAKSPPTPNPLNNRQLTLLLNNSPQTQSHLVAQSRSVIFQQI